MTEYIGNTIPAPGLSINNPGTTDQELKASSAGFSQKGGTLKGGQGVVLIGTVLARDTVSKQWVKYDADGTNGADVPGGILRKTVDTGSVSGDGGYQANIVFRGSLRYDLVSSANGAELSAAVTALGAKANTVLNIFTF